MVRSAFVVMLPAFTRCSSVSLCRSVSSAFSQQLFRIPLRICAMQDSVSYPEHRRILGDSQSEVAGRVFCTFFAGS